MAANSHVAEHALKKYVTTSEACEYQFLGASEKVVVERKCGEWFAIGLKTEGSSLNEKGLIYDK